MTQPHQLKIQYLMTSNWQGWKGKKFCKKGDLKKFNAIVVSFFLFTNFVSLFSFILLISLYINVCMILQIQVLVSVHDIFIIFIIFYFINISINIFCIYLLRHCVTIEAENESTTSIENVIFDDFKLARMKRKKIMQERRLNKVQCNSG